MEDIYWIPGTRNFLPYSIPTA